MGFKTIPRVNGGIVALDPFTGEVKALVGGLAILQVNLTELLKLNAN